MLTVIEELVVGRLHGHAFAATWAEYRQKPVVSLFAKSLVVLLILLPLIATRELSRILGPGVLRKMLIARQKD